MAHWAKKKKKNKIGALHFFPILHSQNQPVILSKIVFNGVLKTLTSGFESALIAKVVLDFFLWSVSFLLLIDCGRASLLFNLNIFFLFTKIVPIFKINDFSCNDKTKKKIIKYTNV